MITVPRTPRPRPTAARLALATMSTVALFGAGAAQASATTPSVTGPTSEPVLVRSAGSATRPMLTRTSLVKVAAPIAATPAPAAPAGAGAQATSRIFGICGKRLWSSKYMRVSTAKAFVQSFVRAVRAGKTATAAIGGAAAATGIGAPGGAALGLLGHVAGGLIIDLVANRLLANFDHYREIRFQLHVGCKGPFLYPQLRLGGKAKL